MFSRLSIRFYRWPAALVFALAAVAGLDGRSAHSAVLLTVDVSQFEANGTIAFIGVDGALPDISLGPTGNFPELELKNFFVSPKSGFGETAAMVEGLSDFAGHTYGQLFLSGAFSTPAFAEIDGTSLGLLASNGQVHLFSTSETALTGQSVFDVSHLGFSLADFGSGGDLYAQSLTPFKKIGEWRVVTPIPLPTSGALLLALAAGGALLGRRRVARAS